MYPEYSFESSFFTINSHRLHYIDKGEGKVIVMVHGNPSWSYYYRKLIRLLSTSHRVIAIDHIGCGLSDKPQEYEYTLENHINNCNQLLDHLQVKTFSLCVHDWGGAIGFGVAAKPDKKLESALVLNTAAFRSTLIPARIQICRWPLIGDLLVRGLNSFAAGALTMAVSKPMRKPIADAYIAPYNSWQNRVAVAAFVKDIPLSASHRSYNTLVEVEKGLERYQELDLPMLICWGGKDFCFHKDFYDEWCNRFPNAQKHYFENGGHYILEDEFSSIAPLAVSFFGR